MQLSEKVVRCLEDYLLINSNSQNSVTATVNPREGQYVKIAKSLGVLKDSEEINK